MRKLARKDLNLDSMIQSHACYRYTTGQLMSTSYARSWYRASH